MLTIEGLTALDEGEYRLEVINSALPELGTHVSQPIMFELGVDDGFNSGADDNSDDTGGSDNGNDGDGNSSGGTYSGAELFPSTPVLFGPNDRSDSVSLSPEFVWSDIGADYYILHASLQYPTGMTLDVVVDDTTFTPDEIFDDGAIHHWRVRGVKDDEKGEWSEIRRFTTRDEGLPDVAELVSPVHFAQNIDRATELTWEDVGADSYEIRLMNNKTSELLFSDAISDTSYMPLESLPDATNFVWQVKSIKDGVHGAWGPRWEFSTGIYSIEPPALFSPGQGSEYSNLVPTFEWEDVEADQYVILITQNDPTNANGLSGMTHTTTVIYEETTEATYTPEISLEPETQYYWQVQAVIDGEEGEWSDLWEFTLINLPAPVLFGPNDRSDSVSLSPEFVWSDIGADYYILHASRQYPTGMTLDVVVDDTTFTPDEIFDDGAIHHWRVRGVKDDEKGEWSEIRRFTTRDEGLPDVAELVSPVHFAQNIDRATELTWEDVGADSYEIRLMNNKTSELLFSDAISDTSYMPLESLPDATNFVWQVKSIKDGVHGAWGPRWEFSTGVYQNSIEPPTLIAPAEGNVFSNLIPTFEWEEVDADRYVIIITRDDPTNAKSLNGMTNATTSTTVIHEETTEATFTPEIPLEPEIQYYWQVQAIKDGEEGEWSDLWEFTIMKPIAQKAMSVPSIEQQPVVTSLDQNYPNPFNPTTRIEFALSVAQKVSIKVYDMAGRQVATLVDDVLKAGHHSATFDARNLSSGIYFYRFISNSHQFSRKMTLIK